MIDIAKVSSQEGMTNDFIILILLNPVFPFSLKCLIMINSDSDMDATICLSPGSYIVPNLETKK